MKNILIFLFSLLGLCSCSKEDIPQRRKPVVVELEIAPDEPRFITRAADEERITDVNLYLFSSEFEFHQYAVSSHLRFECPPGSYKIYLLANMHRDLGTMTRPQLAAFSLPVKDSYTDLPMSYAGNLTVSASGNDTPIQVKRLLAKIAYSIEIDTKVADMEFESVCFYNVPTAIFPFGSSVPAPGNAGYTNTNIVAIPKEQAAHYSSVVYLPENAQGKVYEITDQRQKSAENAPPHATYMLIRACRGNKRLKYSVYLGENNTDDFNLLRNTSHIIDITILGDDRIDSRVETAIDLSVDGTANSYIAPELGMDYYFNARVRGNGRSTTGIKATPISGGAKAQVIWETGSTYERVIRSAEYVDGQIRFETGDIYGNALIGLFDASGRCIWSWHIWVTDFDPLATSQTYTGGRIFMDRNLGALSNAGSGISAQGLYYQWGRKDPFIYPASGSSFSQYFVTYTHGFSYDTTEPMMGYGEQSVSYSIEHPWVFMQGVLMNDDHYDDAPDWLSVQNPNLWGNSSDQYTLKDNGSKSVYDPCPPGWRVPDRNAYADNLRKRSYNPGYYRIYFSSAATTAIFPLCGYWNASRFYDYDKAVLLWTNAPAIYNSGPNYYKHYSTALKISSAGIEPLSRISRDCALPIRCVRE